MKTKSRTDGDGAGDKAGTDNEDRARGHSNGDDRRQGTADKEGDRERRRQLMGTKSRTDADGAGNKAATARGRAQQATGKAREGKRKDNRRRQAGKTTTPVAQTDWDNE